jgi:hypothetical protein
VSWQNWFRDSGREYQSGEFKTTAELYSAEQLSLFPNNSSDGNSSLIVGWLGYVT